MTPLLFNHVVFIVVLPFGSDVVRSDALGRGLRGLPLRLLLGGLGPFAGARGSPVAALSAIPGSGEGRSGGFPLTTSGGGSGLDSGRGLLLGGLLLLGLLLGLGIRIAVWDRRLARRNNIQRCTKELERGEEHKKKTYRSTDRA